MPGLFLLLSIIGAVCVLNALRSVPVGPLAVVSFFAGWLTSELAPHILAVHLVVVAVFVAEGAVKGIPGAVALGLCVFTAAGLLYLIHQARQAGAVMDAALRRDLGDDYRTRIGPRFADRHDLTEPWTRLVLMS